MTQVIPEQQLDLAHIKAALGKFARESGFTYKKNVKYFLNKKKVLETSKTL